MYPPAAAPRHSMRPSCCNLSTKIQETSILQSNSDVVWYCELLFLLFLSASLFHGSMVSRLSKTRLADLSNNAPHMLKCEIRASQFTEQPYSRKRLTYQRAMLHKVALAKTFRVPLLSLLQGFGCHFVQLLKGAPGVSGTYPCAKQGNSTHGVGVSGCVCGCLQVCGCAFGYPYPHAHIQSNSK